MKGIIRIVMVALPLVVIVIVILSDIPAPDGTAELNYEVTVDAANPGIDISPTLYGVFFEEINHAGDGGIYAELVANRSFEDNPDVLEYWNTVKSGAAEGSAALDTTELPNEIQQHSLALTVKKIKNGERFGVSNSGFWGISIQKGASYRLSFYAKAGPGFTGGLDIALESRNGKQIFADASVSALSPDWTRHELVLTAAETSNNAYLVISAKQTGTVYLDVVSLFPETWKSRPNGLRRDLAEMVQAMEPNFLRFPGGCFVEGDTLENAYPWEKTIGDIAERPGHWNLWGYRASDGLGYHEFLQWAEDLGAEPLYVVNIGISHRLDNAAGNYSTVPLDELGPWIQDALDAIEYANGPVTGKWGAVRAENGHPEPFGLKYVEIGNENNFQFAEYVARYPLFYKAIKDKYPEIVLISNAHLGNQPVEMVDEHYYNTPQWFIDNADRYDNYDRSGPAIYVGEYAVTRGAGNGNLHAALGEAAFMTGLERNSDVVKMASYAPLFANINNKVWNPDAILFSNDSAYGTPSYYVQSLFSQNVGDSILPVKEMIGGADAEGASIAGKIGVGTWATQVEYDDLKVVSNGKTLLEDDFAKNSAKWESFRGGWLFEDGVYKQMGADTDAKSLIGDPGWNNYTMTLKARKTSGAEGMLIVFGAKDNDNYYWWNLGGWGNTQHAVEKAVNGTRTVVGTSKPGSIESGRWYEIKIELERSRIRCYLDGELIHEISDSPSEGPMFYVSSLDKESGDIILKAVNISEEEQRSIIKLKGISGNVLSGTTTVLQSEYLSDQNSLTNPDKIAPVAKPLSGLAESFDYTFPKYSVTVLRIQTGS